MPFRTREKYNPARTSRSYASSTSKSLSEVSSLPDVSVTPTQKKKKKKWLRFISKNFRRDKKRTRQRYLSSVSSLSEINEEVLSISTKPSSTKMSVMSSCTESCGVVNSNNLPTPKVRARKNIDMPLDDFETRKVSSNITPQTDVSAKEIKMLDSVDPLKDEVLDVPYPKPRSVVRNNLQHPSQKTPPKSCSKSLLSQPINQVSAVNIIATPSPNDRGKKSINPTPKPRCRPQHKINDSKNIMHISNSGKTSTETDKPHYLVVEVVYHGRSLDSGEKGIIQRKVAKLVDEMLQKQSGNNTDQIKAVSKETESASPNLPPAKQQGNMAQNYFNLLNQRSIQQPKPQYNKQQKHQRLQGEHGNNLNTSDIRTTPARQHIKPKNHHLEAMPIQFHSNAPEMTPLSDGHQTTTYLTQDDLDDTNFFHHQGFDFHLSPHPHPIIEKDHDRRKYQGLNHGETPQDERRQLNFSGEESSLQRLMDFMNAEGRSPSHTSNPRKYQHRQKPSSKSPGNSPKLRETHVSPQNAAPVTSSPKSPGFFRNSRKNETQKSVTPPPLSKEKSPGRKSPLSLFTRRKGPSPSGTSPTGAFVNVYNESEFDGSTSAAGSTSTRMVDHVRSDHNINHIMRTNNHEILYTDEDLMNTTGQLSLEQVTPVMSSRQFRNYSRTPATPTEHDAWWMPRTWARERAIGAFGRAWKFEEDLEKERERELLVAKNANVEKIRTSNFIRF